MLPLIFKWGICLLEFDVLATSTVISDTDLWQCAHKVTAPLEDQDTGTITQYPIQSHYHDIERTCFYPVLLMLCARLGSDKYKFGKSLVWFGLDLRPLETGPRSCWFAHPIQSNRKSVRRTDLYLAQLYYVPSELHTVRWSWDSAWLATRKWEEGPFQPCLAFTIGQIVNFEPINTWLLII